VATSPSIDEGGVDGGGLMRIVVLQQYAVSLDGYSCADDSEFSRYVRGVVDDELDHYFIDELGRAGTHVMGNVVYGDMARHWPTASGPIAAIMNDVPKVVFSRSREVADWGESRIARGDTAEEIAKLKSEPGGEILVHGGFRFTQSLARLGLVDQYRLYVFPVALGHGSSIFATVAGLTELRLASSTQFASGVVLLKLEPATRGSSADDAAGGA
jgi:dihydrofolate reductase